MGRETGRNLVAPSLLVDRDRGAGDHSDQDSDADIIEHRDTDADTDSDVDRDRHGIGALVHFWIVHEWPPAPHDPGGRVLVTGWRLEVGVSINRSVGLRQDGWLIASSVHNHIMRI